MSEKSYIFENASLPAELRNFFCTVLRLNYAGRKTVDSHCQVCRRRGKLWVKVTGKSGFYFLDLRKKAIGFNSAIETHPHA